MISDVTRVRDLFPVTPLHVVFIVQHQTAATGDELAVTFDDQLPLGKMLQLTLDLITPPRLHVGKAVLLHFHQRVVVADLHRPQDQFPLKIAYVIVRRRLIGVVVQADVVGFVKFAHQFVMASMVDVSSRSEAGILDHNCFSRNAIFVILPTMVRRFP